MIVCPCSPVLVACCPNVSPPRTIVSHLHENLPKLENFPQFFLSYADIKYATLLLFIYSFTSFNAYVVLLHSVASLYCPKLCDLIDSVDVVNDYAAALCPRNQRYTEPPVRVVNDFADI